MTRISNSDCEKSRISHLFSGESKNRSRIILLRLINIYFFIGLMRTADNLVITKLKRVTFISFTFMIVELFGGYYASSIAIFADAFHLLSDVVAYSISLYVVTLSAQSSPRIYTFGYQKMQPLGALVNVAIIWMVTAELFVEATKRIFNKAVVEEPLYMLVISIFGLFCNLFIMYILNGDNVSPESINLNTALPSDCFETDQPSNQRRLLRYSNKLKRDELKLIPLEEVGQKKSYDAEPSRFNNNINIKAAYIHIFTDIILSIGVIVSASLIYFFAPSNQVWSPWQIADPMCTYLFSFLAIYTTFPIIRESGVLLLNGCDNEQVLDEIQLELKKNPMVVKVQSLKIWSTNRGTLYGALRIRVKKGDREELSCIFSSRKIDGFVHFLQQQQPLTSQLGR